MQTSDHRQKARRLADLRNVTEELERRLDSVRSSLAAELGHPAPGPAAGHATGQRGRVHGGAGSHHHGADAADMTATIRGYSFGDAGAAADFAEDDDPVFGDDATAQWRTEELVSHGRRTSRPGRRLARKAAISGAGFAVLLSLILAITLSGGGASWPASVATVQAEAVRACQNPDVKSEPGQVDFACAKATQQTLWVFALLTSDDNPGFADAQTGRVGLEPITPDQGGEVAWSLNLHHPYNPLNAVDSLSVAARAINSIIGGATVTGTDGAPVVQQGLEGDAANCLRYTGSSKLTSRQGFPSLCAKPVTTTAGQGALVADVYQEWMVGATPQQAQNAAVLFENADNPGNPQVQVILRQLQNPAA
jgi:hypothetical protein